ncbi:MAG: hypothetical protein HOG49_03620, partial [Candidatus Scalindua sp.]|nr:hypothetical protein [Candidatus Scalindua sp.]
STQYLGELIPLDRMNAIEGSATYIDIDGNKEEGEAFRSYVHKAPEVIKFMSKFMTLSAGDIWGLGPLVASKLPEKSSSFIFGTENLRVNARVTEWPGY